MGFGRCIGGRTARLLPEDEILLPRNKYTNILISRACQERANRRRCARPPQGLLPCSIPTVCFRATPQRAIARRLYAEVRDLPIVSPHGHTDPAWYAENQPFADPATLFVIPDHYAFRMLYSQGVLMESLGVPRRDGGPVERDTRTIWRALAANWTLFRGTPTRVWLEHAFEQVFGIEETLSAASADRLYDQIDACLKKPEFRPARLFGRFNIEVLATTDPPLDPLTHHRGAEGQRLEEAGW